MNTAVLPMPRLPFSDLNGAPPLRVKRAARTRRAASDVRLIVPPGAGYIGSHTCKLPAKEGYTPVAYDDLSLGHDSAVLWGPLVMAVVADSRILANTIRDYRIDSVIYFAGFAYVGESVDHPRKYFHNNLSKTIAMLGCLLDEGVTNIVLSSTCATYGIPQQSRIVKTIHSSPPIRMANPRSLQLSACCNGTVRRMD